MGIPIPQKEDLTQVLSLLTWSQLVFSGSLPQCCWLWATLWQMPTSMGNKENPIVTFLSRYYYIYLFDWWNSDACTIPPRLPKWSPFPSCTSLRDETTIPHLWWERGIASQNCEACTTKCFMMFLNVFMFFFKNYLWWVVRRSETIEMENRAHQSSSTWGLTRSYSFEIYV